MYSLGLGVNASQAKVCVVNPDLLLRAAWIVQMCLIWLPRQWSTTLLQHLVEMHWLK